jgi:hypothetical protein
VSAAATRPTGPLRTGTARTGTVRSGTLRAGTPRAGAARSGTPRAGVHRTGALRSGPRSVPVRPQLALVPPARTRSTRTGRGRAAGDRSRRAPFVLLVVALLAGTTLALLVLNTAIAVDSLRATTLRQGNTTREQEVQRLEQQVIDGSTPQSVAGDAATAGLVPAGAPGYLVVQPDGSSTLRGTPSPAPAAPLPPVPGAQTPPPAAPAPAAGTVPAPAGGTVPAPAGTTPGTTDGTAPGAGDQAAGD